MIFYYVIKTIFCYLFSAEVKMPSGNVDKPIIEDNRDGTVCVKYDPREEGLHELYVKYNGEHVQGKTIVPKSNIVLKHDFFGA